MDSGLVKMWKAVLILVLTAFLSVGILTIFAGQYFFAFVFLSTSAVIFLSIFLLFIEKLPMLSSTYKNPLYFGGSFIVTILGANLVFFGIPYSWLIWGFGIISFLYTIIKK